MLTPFDDYPIHQTSLPLAQPGGGHPDHYDRFWFNGFREDLYLGVAFATYPNRGIMDGAFSVVRGGMQRSVFASGRMPLDPTRTEMGPIRIEVVEPMRVNRVVVDAPEHGLRADLTYTAVTAAYEEPHQTRYAGTRLAMDVTRATQWGVWTGTLEVGGETIDLGAEETRGTKDRSWGTRPVGAPAPAAPPTEPRAMLFLWAPTHFDDECFHFLVFENPDGTRWAEAAALIPKLGAGDPVFGAERTVETLTALAHDVDWAPGMRRSDGARLRVSRVGDASGVREELRLEPLMAFRMKGIGYGHPTWGHGHWHGELEVGAEAHRVEDLDDTQPDNVHVQQVMRVTWGEKTGLGVLEQAMIGPHERYGFRDAFGGAVARTA
jgi:hypothetical protein